MKQHGFARDLPWEVAETRDRDAAQATLVLVANDATRAAFPWDFRLSITFSLAAARLRLDVRVENGLNARDAVRVRHSPLLPCDRQGARPGRDEGDAGLRQREERGRLAP